MTRDTSLSLTIAIHVIDNAAFEQIQRAYAVLSDSARRALYDRWRMSHLQIPFEVFEGLGTHAQVRFNTAMVAYNL